MNAGRMLSINSKGKAKSTEKLSSGYKINRAADGAAELSISEKMRWLIRGLTQGVKNVEDGIDVCKTADGALTEVCSIFHRMEELAVKSANDTNAEEDRQTIQDEIQHLLDEIDRIGDTTQFNGKYLFKGKDVIRVNADGSSMTVGDIPFGDFSLADLDLGRSPFGSGSNSSTLQLEALVNNPDSLANGTVYKLIFGDGSTSSSSIRLKYDQNGETVTRIVDFNSLTPTNFVSGVDENGNAFWSRDLIYERDGVGVKITQKIAVDDSGADEKKYSISYSFENIGDKDVSMDFMFHADTAYNNNDLCEGYYEDGERIRESCIYSKSDSSFTDGETNSNIIDGIPDSISIVDVERALAFSEKIRFTGDKPDSVSIGQYYEICNWDYYDSLNSYLGQNIVGSDLGFSLLWNFDMSAGSSNEVSFDYGIARTENDSNLKNVEIVKDSTILADHYGNIDLWIQSGAEGGEGLWLTFDEMNTDVLGIAKLDLSTRAGAWEAIDLVAGALKYVTKLRSAIGAQQNRLEYTVENENNILENTTRAESIIRDTDMAEEMVRKANLSILEQATQSVLAQANHQNDYVLQLLQ